MDTGLVHRAVCLFTSQFLLCWYWLHPPTEQVNSAWSTHREMAKPSWPAVIICEQVTFLKCGYRFYTRNYCPMWVSCSRVPSLCSDQSFTREAWRRPAFDRLSYNVLQVYSSCELRPPSC